ncbi:hypothetical protein [Cloacibacterium sp.]|uniref:hypothetical protein n=1 Tax=Cloacibacterium sp. TaxID=1913682 RepID=UPI0035B4637F
MKKKLTSLVFIISFLAYGQKQIPTTNSGIAYGSGINKNVQDNAYRVEYWGSFGNIVEDYEKAKASTTDKSKLKDLLLDAIYRNEQEKKNLDEKYSIQESSIDKINSQLNSIKDKESSKFKKLNLKLENKNKELNIISTRLIKNINDNKKLQEEYLKITS